MTISIELFRTTLQMLLGASLLVLADIILGALSAAINKAFSWEKLTSYISSDLVPVLAWLVVNVVFLLMPESTKQSIPQLSGYWETGSVIIYITVVGRIAASVLGHLSALGLLTNTFQKVAIPPSSSKPPKPPKIA